MYQIISIFTPKTHTHTHKGKAIYTRITNLQFLLITLLLSLSPSLHIKLKIVPVEYQTSLSHITHEGTLSACLFHFPHFRFTDHTCELSIFPPINLVPVSSHLPTHWPSLASNDYTITASTARPKLHPSFTFNMISIILSPLTLHSGPTYIQNIFLSYEKFSQPSQDPCVTLSHSIYHHTLTPYLQHTISAIHFQSLHLIPITNSTI
jgi:hypothetical protein